MQNELFPCEGCLALRRRLLEDSHRLNHCERLVDAMYQYLQEPLVTRPINTIHIRDLIISYNLSHHRKTKDGKTPRLGRIESATDSEITGTNRQGDKGAPRSWESLPWMHETDPRAKRNS